MLYAGDTCSQDMAFRVQLDLVPDLKCQSRWKFLVSHVSSDNQTSALDFKRIRHIEGVSGHWTTY
jgi:hypothetical protein